jgi:osmoprotectant transport system permease protein
MKLLTLILLLLTTIASAQTITVGSKRFTESYVLGEIAKKKLEDAGFQAKHREGMGNTMIVWQFLEDGTIDAYCEYTGTLSEEILKKPGLTLHEIRQELDKKGIGVTDELGFNNTYALVMKKEKAEALGIKKISDLKNHLDLKAGPTHEFLERKDGWKQVMAKYGINMPGVTGIDHTLGYAALNAGKIDIKDCYSTDAEIAKYGLVVLEDDQHFFPSYMAVFVYRKSMPEKAREALQSVAGTIDATLMSRLNAHANDTKDNTAAAEMYFKETANRVVDIEQQSMWSSIAQTTWEHLQLVGISLLLAILIGVPLGIFAAQQRWLGGLILGTTGAIQTIPSLALLALLIPIMPNKDAVPVLALVLYSLLPIVRNTAAGLTGIAAPLRESAEALGLEAATRLRRIYLPLALPTIMAGIKTSAVINVGTATIAALVGAGGYGRPIISGLAIGDTNLILQGAIPAALLALLVQILFDRIEHAVVPRGLRL